MLTKRDFSRKLWGVSFVLVFVLFWSSCLRFPPAFSLVGYRFIDLRYLRKISFLVNQKYVDSSLIEPNKMLRNSLEKIELVVPSIMIEFASDEKSVSVKVGKEEKTFPLRKLANITSVPYQLKDIFIFLRKHYRGDVKFRDIEFAAIHGMLSSLDAHSNFLPPSYYKDLQINTGGEFGGLGIVIQSIKGQLTIMSPMPNTPASRAGVRPMDRIVRIGDESTINMTLTEAVQLLRGKPNTPVVIWIMRKGFSKPRSFRIVRAIIKVQSVSSRTMKNQIGYIRIKNFQRNTYKDMYDAIQKIEKKTKGIKGLILDLRDNPGGLLDQGIQVADTFLSKGEIVSHAGGSSQKQTVFAQETNTVPDFPMIVLVNRGSASASEIVAGALKNNERALILGQRTYGKGTVQTIYPISTRNPLFSKDEFSALKLTIAQYLTPGDVSIHKVGVSPDVAVHIVNIEKEDVHFWSANTSKKLDLKKLPAYLKGIRDNQKALYNFTHLDLTTLKERQQQYENAYLNKKEQKTEFIIQLAHKLLASTKYSGRKTFYNSIQSVLKAEHNKAKKQIVAELKKIGVNWSPAFEKLQKPSLSISYTFVPVKKPVHSVLMHAGNSFKFKLQVRNTGKHPIYQARALLRSSFWFLNRKEFIFGKILPQKRKSWTVEVQLPNWLQTQYHEAKVDVFSALKNHKETQIVPFRFVGYKKPRFAFSYGLEEVQGNGDGLIQANETFRLRVSVRNIGKGKAINVLGILKNKTGKELFMQKGRVRLGALLPKQNTTAFFEFKVNKAPANKSLEMELSIFDAEILTTSREMLSLNVDKNPEKIEPKKNLWVKVKENWSWLLDGSASDANKVARVGKNSMFSVLAQSGPFFKLKVTGNYVKSLRFMPDKGKKTSSVTHLELWIHQKDIELLTKRPNRKKKQIVQHFWKNKTPSIQWIGKKRPILRETSDFELHVKVSNNTPLRDVYVLLNNKKVFFHSQKKEPTLVIKKTLKLKKGKNTIYVVARENETFSGYAEYIVFYKEKPLKKIVLPVKKNVPKKLPSKKQ